MIPINGLAKYKLVVILLALTSLAFAGNKTDSLRRVVRTGNDTNKLKAMNALSNIYYFGGKHDSCYYYANSVRELSEELLSSNSLPAALRLAIQKQRAVSYKSLGGIYVDKGDFENGLKYDTAGLAIAKAIGDKKLIADAYGNLGALYTCSGDYVNALDNEFNALKLDEQTGNKRGMISAYTNIGNIYSAEKNYPEALKNHQKCLELSKETGFKQGMAWAYNNMGDIYETQGNSDKALEEYQECLKVGTEVNYQEVIAASYANIGTILSDRGKYNEALKDERASLKVWQEMGANQYVANLYTCLGEVFLKQGAYDSAMQNLDKGLAMSLKSGYKEIAKQSYQDLSNVYEGMAKKGVNPSENWEKAHENYKQYVKFNDSLFNESTRKKSEQAQLQFEFDKKQAIAKEEQDKKEAVMAQQRQKQKAILRLLTAGLFLLLVLAFFIYRGYWLKKKANVIISKQKDLVEQKNQIIEAKNKSITDSINYARLIQSAMFAPEDEMAKTLGEHFIYYQPKDIVSGDFYFFKNLSGHGGPVYLAACDCTGHGVPGAFMSLIGNEKLNDAVEQVGDTAGILKLLNKQIRYSLHQSRAEDSTRDGMDIALCSINGARKGDTVQLQYSGANRPLWIVRNGNNDIEEVKPTKKSIGGFTEEDTSFDAHKVELKKGDTFYLFTDGYADQFGGLDGKKLTTKKFREFIKGIKNHAMQEQKALIKKFMEEWMGVNEQVDDILVIGVRV